VDEKDIEPHGPVGNITERNNNGFSSHDFQKTDEAHEYRRAIGHPLRSEWRAIKTQRLHVTKTDTLIFSIPANRLRDMLDERMMLPALEAGS